MTNLPTPKGLGRPIRQIAIGLELPFLLVAPVLAGGAIGYFLDRWFHTKPTLMIVLGLIGIGVGIFDALKVASKGDK